MAVFTPKGFVGAAGTPRDTLTLEQRCRLEKALEDSTLTRWQRSIASNVLNPRAIDIGESLPGGGPHPQGPAGIDGDWSRILLAGVSGHTAIYDPVHDRMVVFGGYGSFDAPNGVWALSMSGSPPWSQLNPTGTAPSARFAHSAIHDPVRDRMVIFGGYDSEALNDVWALSLSETPEWTQLIPAGTPPPAVVGHRAIYDPVRDRMVVFGGADWSLLAYPNDVWALSLSGTPAWTQLTPTGTPPTGRGGSTAIYDPVRDRMLIFGGEDDGYPNRTDTWALSLSGTPAWTELTPLGTPPPGRAHHTAIYDPGRDGMIVFGGTYEGGHSRLDDAWALSLSGSPAWAQLTPTRTPRGRLAHTAIYDPVRDRMVVFGGDEDVYYPDLNDVWSLSLSGSPEWTPGPGTPPPPRSGHTAIYDRARDRMVIFGGRYSDFRDVWALSLSEDPEWTELIPTGTPPAGGTAIYDPVRDRMVVFGGSEVMALSLSENPKWTELTFTGTPAGGTAVYDPVRDRVIVYGGNDVRALSLSGAPTWTELPVAGASPPARYGGHTAIYDPPRDRMVIFGGTDANYPYPQRNDVWALSLSGTPEWTELTPAGTLAAAREDHTAIYDPVRDRMVVFQGHSHAVGYDGDPWALSLSGTPAWTHLTPTGTRPGGRDGHSAIYDPVRDRMVIFGGSVDMHSDWEDVWALEWGAPIDTTPPQIAVTLSRETLWPPNHKLVEVCATVTVLDASDSNPMFVLYSVTSSEPDNDTGDGNTTGDIAGAAIGTPDLCYDLRAERQGNGNGREYRIVYQAKDASNNIAYDTVSVRVPHDMSGDVKRATALLSVHPNPFNPETTVEYSLSANERVRIAVYDVRGVLVTRLVDELMPAGEHRATWNGLDDAGQRASSGIYFVRMVAPSYIETRKIAMLK